MAVSIHKYPMNMNMNVLCSTINSPHIPHLQQYEIVVVSILRNFLTSALMGLGFRFAFQEYRLPCKTEKPAELGFE